MEEESILVFVDNQNNIFRALLLDGTTFVIDLLGYRGGPLHLVAVAPGLRIRDISWEESASAGGGRLLVVTLERAETRPDESMAFLEEIEIGGNEITNMGLSGIGLPHDPGSSAPPARAAAEAAAAEPPTAGHPRGQLYAPYESRLVRILGNPVAGLDIHRNVIQGCLQRPFDDALEAAARRLGFGGITLGLCSDLVISENRIISNGRSHLDPVCGVFIRAGDRVAVRDNFIGGNGPTASTSEAELRRGLRGGIVARVAELLAGPATRLSSRSPDPMGRPAAVIHGNVVSQPAGAALLLYLHGRASGTTASVTHNHFSSRLLNRAGVLVSSTGHVLFEGNETRVESTGAARWVQAIQTRGDLIFSANHSRVDGSCATNTQLYAKKALNASRNRFEEPGGADMSLTSHANLVNDTSHNQGDHCIEASGLGQLVDSPNQVLDTTLCPERAEIVGQIMLVKQETDSEALELET